MIFSETIHLLLSDPPRKTQTLRLAYEGDHLGIYEGPEWTDAVFEKPFIRFGKEYRRPRWVVGHKFNSDRLGSAEEKP